MRDVRVSFINTQNIGSPTIVKPNILSQREPCIVSRAVYTEPIVLGAGNLSHQSLQRSLFRSSLDGQRLALNRALQNIYSPNENVIRLMISLCQIISELLSFKHSSASMSRVLHVQSSSASHPILYMSQAVLSRISKLTVLGVFGIFLTFFSKSSRC